MSKNIFFIDLDREKRNTAGAKAPDDVSKICLDRGYKRFVVPNFPFEKGKIGQKIWLLTVCFGWWKKLERQVSENDIILMQHPLYGKRAAKQMIPKIREKKKCKFIAIIHDLESLRGGIAGVIVQNKKTEQFGDNNLLKEFDAIICHNDSMKQYMIDEMGFERDKLISLEIFDYLSDYCRTEYKKGAEPTIAIAGNLAKAKCAYIYDICTAEHNLGLKVNLYGNNYEDSCNDNRINWLGSFKPEELPANLKCDFGLVWDGNSADTCAGNTGNYLKYNNPHKTSLYLSAGIPVIVWKSSAMAKFVLDNKVGIAVENLHNLDKEISMISDSEYSKMCDNAIEISKKLRSGGYFAKAFDEALKII